MIWDLPPPVEFESRKVAEVVYVAQKRDTEELPPLPLFSNPEPPAENRSAWPKPLSIKVLVGSKLPKVSIREIQSMNMPKGFIQTTMPRAGRPGEIVHEFHTKDRNASLLFLCEGLMSDRKPRALLERILKTPPHVLSKEEVRNLIVEADEPFLPYYEKDARVRTVNWHGRTVIEQQYCNAGHCSYGIIYDRRYRRNDEPLRMAITFSAPKDIFEQRLPEIKACLKSLKWSKQIAPQ